MRGIEIPVLAAGLILAGVAGDASGDAEDLAWLRQRVGELEERVHELEAQRDAALAAEDRAIQQAVQRVEPSRVEAVSQGADWERRWRLSGNADFAYSKGDDNSLAPDGRSAVDNARIFFDVDLGWGEKLGNRPLLGSSSFFFEWDIVRRSSVKNTVGSMYVQLEELMGATPLNLRLGRMPIPFGEEYLRFHAERPSNPLISFSAPAPYNWDSGAVLYGSALESRLSWAFSIMNGEEGFAANYDSQPAVSGKVSFRPWPWMRISLSGYESGRLGSSSRPGESALEFAGTHAVPFGSDSDVDNYQNGVVVPDDPEANRLDGLTAWEADVILDRPGVSRLWLAYGQAGVDGAGSSQYDRDLRYWITEAIFELGVVSSALDRLYVAGRYSEFGTFDSDEGYLIDVMYLGTRLGFNTERVAQVSAGIGFRMTDRITLKTEYSWFDFDLVRGVPDSLRDLAGDKDVFRVGLSLDL